MATLINGNLNDPVYAAQDADLIAAICGNQTCITPVGGKFEATLEDANTIMVEDGVIITQEGRRIQLDAGDIDEFIIPTGSQGITQYYIVGYRLYTDSESAELCENFVEPVDSASETINEGTFRGGETEVYVSLLRVKQEGVNITDIEVLLPYSTDITQINNDLSKLSGKFVHLHGTSNSTLYDALSNLTVEQFARATVMCVDNLSSAVRTYVPHNANSKEFLYMDYSSSSGIMFFLWFITPNSATRVTKNTNGSTASDNLTISSWDIYI